ncbi:MAG: type I DNA topoisomerase [Bacteroidales bacterium]|nr:type I DNA topoisomerase [Bacteroidales bacterium]MBN2763175.1 type I DNA topoisomerase [Bacteroidales bacterium]
MINNLVIVESPAKAKTIEKILGKDFQVRSSMGHIRDLLKNEISIDIKNRFKPQYIVPPDKKKVVSELKEVVRKAKTVWLASDEDREGEAIAWHLSEVLNLDPEKTKRIVFHEITKEAIDDAIKNPRSINQDLVNAQQARRVLDRIVGYELSPVLWKKIKPSLSAGRVQSVAVRLIVEREREIINFKSTSSFKVNALFYVNDKSGKSYQLKAELNNKFPDRKKALEFLSHCKTADFSIENILKKPARKSPSPPFTTSTLQQEASRKLNFSVAQTMTVAQRLYEAGKITYMRTDSVNLATTALDAASNVIEKTFGEQYSNRKNYKTKSKGAQEAHEAIRPTHLDKETITGNATEKKLYELIWKRTIASQMSDAQLERTTVTIAISNATEKFIAEGEVLKFDGFLKVYFESSDEEPEEDVSGLLPPIEKGMPLACLNIVATERFTHNPPRYTEASLVKKLEELGIGRPSTYAPTISTIQQRGYVMKEDRPGRERKYTQIILENKTIKEDTKTEITGAEKSKLFPDNIGMIVNDFLVEYFNNILDYNFTASVEKEFDEIATGNLNWFEMIGKFYKPFHEKVNKTLAKSAVNKGERKLGTDPETGKPVLVRMGRFGAVVQIGELSDSEKPRYASLRKGQNLESITLEEALELFRLPRTIGKFEDKDIIVSIGRFGPYILHNSTFYSLNKNTDDPYSVTAGRAIEIIQEKRLRDEKKVLRTFQEDAELSILNGRWGPYIKYKKENYKIPKTSDPSTITYEECLALIKDAPSRKKKKK